jgi:hypothetical protein
MPTESARRAILNVATGPYVPLQDRLVKSLAAAGWTGGVLTWTNALPPGSPPHEDAPYGFKLYAIAEALRKGYLSVLWLDAPCVATRPLAPVFEKIEREGHCFVSGDERLGNWASDDCLAASSGWISNTRGPASGTAASCSSARRGCSRARR